MILEHAVAVGDRDFSCFALTQAEADAMIVMGFRFAVYDKRDNLFELEPPFGQSGNGEAGTWTFRQEAMPTTIEITATVIAIC